MVSPSRACGRKAADAITITMLCRFSRRHSFRMSHLSGERRTRGSLLDALSGVIRARRDTKGFVYRTIPTMQASERNDIGDLSDVILQESSDAETQVIGYHRTCNTCLVWLNLFAYPISKAIL